MMHMPLITIQDGGITLISTGVTIRIMQNIPACTKTFCSLQTSLDDQLAKLAATTQSFIEGNNQRFQNVEASIKSLEQQFGQLAAQISDREKGKFPSQTVPNPKGHEDCNVVRTLQCGKSYENRENSIENEKLAVEDNAKNFAAAEPTKNAEKHNLADLETVPK
ncbi:hypothetical protein L3X38_036902 [Prunus dulcis]|uniref:Uncharacterized protein n=1 Tax=Prunus dulcis TaxID=3755 RepID=A0AAD4V2C1_PRUDU|nr:hypothetical protein L3X38_036902 [Prunus dulcis]